MRRLMELSARRGTGVLVIALSAIMVASALIGSAVDAVVPAVVIAVILGCAAAAFVSAVVAANARALAQRIDAIAGVGGADARSIFGGREEWRELAQAIDRIVASLDEQASELADERVRSKEVLAELPSAVMLFADGDVVYANRAALEMFDVDEVDPTPVAAEPFFGIVAKPLLDAIDEALEVGRPIDVEIETDKGILAARASMLGSGEAVLVIRDVTRARRLAAVRRDFVINASHELKTPVAGIQALAESLSLALRHDPGRAERMVGRIEQEAARLARLVRDLLDLARLEEAGDDEERRHVDAVEIINAQIERVSGAALRQQITITTDLPGTSLVVAAPEDLRTIVGNLLENAVRYNRRGGSVAVTLSRTDGRVVLEIADTGEGIPPQDLERIFERFYRVDKARSRAAGGTGLGLSLVRHATQRLGGTLAVDSELGVGSTFRVELPVA